MLSASGYIEFVDNCNFAIRHAYRETDKSIWVNRCVKEQCVYCACVRARVSPASEFVTHARLRYQQQVHSSSSSLFRLSNEHFLVHSPRALS